MSVRTFSQSKLSLTVYNKTKALPATGLGSVTFNGSNQYLSTTSGSYLQPGTQDFTLEFWVKSSFSSRMGIFGPVSTGGAFVLIDNSSFTIGRQGTAQDQTFSGTIASNTWTHIALCRSSGTMRGFIDGTSVGSGSNTNSYSFNGGMEIGRLFDWGALFNGSISNVRFTYGAGLYTTNFARPTNGFVAATSGTNGLIACQSPTSATANVSANNLTITNNNGATASSANPFTG